MKVSDRESINIWGKLLFFMGVGIIIGFAYFINGQYLADVYVNWELINSVLLWLIFVVLIIMVNKEHTEEMRCIKELTKNQLNEIKLLRKDLKKKK